MEAGIPFEMCNLPDGSPLSAFEVFLRHNLLVYGVGGILVPFAAIKLIDCIVAPLLGVL